MRKTTFPKGATISQKYAKLLKLYVEDPDKRCQNASGGCYYSGITAKADTPGCLIGQALSQKSRLLLDSSGVGQGIISICMDERTKHLIPDFIMNDINLANAFQELHDIDNYWTSLGLSENGKSKLERIINYHNLDKEDFSYVEF